MQLADVAISAFLTWLISQVARRPKPDPASPATPPNGPEALPTPPFVPAPPVPRPRGAVPAPSYPAEVPWPKGDLVPQGSTPASAQRETVPLALQPKPEPKQASQVLPRAWRDTPGTPGARGAQYTTEVKRQSGGAVPQSEYAAVLAREQKPFDREYWRPRVKPSPGEVKQAVALLKNWKSGLVVYYGPRSFGGRRQYRAAKHGGKNAIEVWEPAPPFV
jgi:hypothetical protein